MPSYAPSETRYDTMRYNRCGNSGLNLPAISLGLWHNFGGVDALETQRLLLYRAFDLGITHFDLANNYGPPPGSAEENFGRILPDFNGYRDELIISTKAGYKMYDGPYGEWGSRKYLLASLDQSLKRLGLDYVDIFYSHRFDPGTPLEETMGALDHAVRSGRALYAGISNYNAAQTREASRILKALGTPCLIHQPKFSLLEQTHITSGALQACVDEGIGCIAFSALAQGLLTGKYLKGIAVGSRATQGKSLDPNGISDDMIARLNRLNGVAVRRGQTLAQMAIAWLLQNKGMTTALIGASRPEQIVDCAGAINNPDFQAGELAEIAQILA
jgi:L-glyceraldehyde 3-phosphate reductase